MSARGDKEMRDLLKRMELKMANPPSSCERCHKPMGEFNRFWEGHSGQWICGSCDKKIPHS